MFYHPDDTTRKTRGRRVSAVRRFDNWTAVRNYDWNFYIGNHVPYGIGIVFDYYPRLKRFDFSIRILKYSLRFWFAMGRKK